MKITSKRRAAAGQQYAIVVGLIAVIAIVAIAAMGSAITKLMARSANTLQSAGGGTISQVAPPPPADTTPPTITGITPPANGNYGAGQTLGFTVAFSETVTVTGAPQIGLTIGTASVFATYASGSGTGSLVFNYTIVNGDSDTDGIAASAPLALNGGTIVDLAGNAASLGFAVPNLTGVTVDAVAPIVSSVTPPTNAIYNNSQALNFTLNWNKPVTVTGTPQLALTIGATGRNATYISGSGSAALLFRYTVQAADSDGDGITLNTTIGLNGGTITDSLGNAASLGFTAPNLTGVLVQGSCTPGSVTFNYSGGNQTFTVPAGCTTIQVKMWGAGGGSGTTCYGGASGGGGGFTSGTIAVTQAESLTVIVGGGGLNSGNGCDGGWTSPSGGGFGGGGNKSTVSDLGAGGGRSAIRRSATELATAGGGGGGGSFYAPTCTSGGRAGAGGGLNGQAGEAASSRGGGGGGTQSAGGAAGTGGVSGVTPQPGSAFQGGIATSNTFGSNGGGGGYYGGGTGTHDYGSWACAGGAGGGSGYVGGMTSGTTTAGSYGTPAGTGDASWSSGIGVGGGAGANGGHGRVVISYP